MKDKLRNLSFVGKTYCVSGKSTHAGNGILEWCWDLNDAEYIIGEMKKDSRFSELKVEKVQDD